MFNFGLFLRYINRMTKEEFIHIASEMRASAVTQALRFGYATDDVEDIAQDVMLKMWCLHEKVEKTRWKALAQMTTRHVCIDRWRITHVHSGIAEPLSVVDEDSLSDRLEYAELEQWMDEQINTLPSTSRIVLTMRQLEHRELSEIASILGIKQTSVSTLLSRARKELMDKLKRRN